MFDLKTARADANLTQQALAEKSGINIRQLQKIEKGEIQIGNITLRNAKALADALEITIEDLTE